MGKGKRILAGLVLALAVSAIVGPSWQHATASGTTGGWKGTASAQLSLPPGSRCVQQFGNGLGCL
jgi:hypothetical protein